MREEARPTLGLEVTDDEGTAYRTITPLHESDSGGQKWVIAHNEEPFRVEVTLRPHELSKWANDDLLAILRIDGKRLRDT